MTRKEREEAIAYGEDYLRDLVSAACDISERHMNFVKMAISALKAEPCEDVISREHLLSEIDELMQSPWFNNGKDFYDGTLRHYGYVERKEAVEIVRDLCVKAEPSVTPERPKGEWIKIQSGDKDFPESIVCSHCRNENSHLDFDEHSYPIGKVFVTSNFCPNCGADMRKEKK